MTPLLAANRCSPCPQAYDVSTKFVVDQAVPAVVDGYKKTQDAVVATSHSVVDGVRRFLPLRADLGRCWPPRALPAWFRKVVGAISSLFRRHSSAAHPFPARTTCVPTQASKLVPHKSEEEEKKVRYDEPQIN